ncbi:MAG: hypothetical protein HS126_37280 [Anaerolineales bacterium]|nr:hypothetical protein [Anaerolineales bacterium]
MILPYRVMCSLNVLKWLKASFKQAPNEGFTCPATTTQNPAGNAFFRLALTKAARSAAGSGASGVGGF